MPRHRFHLAFPVHDLDAARLFYRDLLGARAGRSAAEWIDFDFYGHQISAHLVTGEAAVVPTNPVDREQVPVRHFGVILEWDEWHELSERLRTAEVEFLIEPQIRFRGEVGEQATLFIRDPSGNALEFKSFRDPDGVFAS